MCAAPGLSRRRKKGSECVTARKNCSLARSPARALSPLSLSRPQTLPSTSPDTMAFSLASHSLSLTRSIVSSSSGLRTAGARLLAPGVAQPRARSMGGGRLSGPARGLAVKASMVRAMPWGGGLGHASVGLSTVQGGGSGGTLGVGTRRVSLRRRAKKKKKRRPQPPSSFPSFSPSPLHPPGRRRQGQERQVPGHRLQQDLLPGACV